MSAKTPQTFLDHLEELRWRLVRSLIAVTVGFLCCFGFAEELFELLMRPVLAVLPPAGQQLHFTGLLEPFMVHLHVGVLGGLFVASPYIFHQVWGFVAPGLYHHERRYVVPFVLVSSLCFVGGALFGYLVVFPAGFRFFLSFTTESLVPVLTMGEYLSLSTKLILVFGLVFETPVIIFTLCGLGIVTPRKLLQSWRYVVVGISIISAVLTPADVLTMILMAIPLLILYFGSTLITMALLRRREPGEAA
ncbi:MAG: twin arginine-targeting protein translocase TatC [Deltaproteobacteria bacterium RIFOXYA12_FULL_61_11]|nr:MAG: twin arginine-targeting protein translocase TatC [Deltaproteobacteria bacterium RIFOXYA12_FULL_61_11]